MASTIRFKRLAGILSFMAVLSIAASCTGGGSQDTAGTEGTEGTEETSTAASSDTSGVAGDVLVDGSSTVFPISEAMAEEFMAENADVRVTVGVSGTGGGFQKFCAGETDISNASRPIKQEEIDLCAENGIEFVELPVAFDGLSVVVNPENDWAQCLTVEELKMMWEPSAEGTISNWNQIRPDFPDAELGLYGPGTDSGTYDYFTAALLDAEGESRGDFTASEDDNVLVQGVIGDTNGLAFFGYAYYEENQDSLQLVGIDNGNGCIEPSAETIGDGSYQPLARPEFVYVKTTSLDNPAVRAFAEYQIAAENKGLIEEVGYVALPDEVLASAQERLEAGTVGSVFEGGSAVGVKLADVL